MIAVEINKKNIPNLFHETQTNMLLHQFQIKTKINKESSKT